MNTPEAEFRTAVWLDDELFAFVYSFEEYNSRLGDFSIATYVLMTDEWQILTVPTIHERDRCNSGPSHFAHLSRLPNGNLGFAHDCLSQQGPSGTLYMWDRQAQTLEVLQDYPKRFSISRYAFSPDMSELIQEEAVGSPLNNTLYRVDQNGWREQLFPHFQRARSPTWSPDGKTIAFAGTETYPGGDSSAFRRWRQIEGLLLYPWDIYLMDADGSNLRILLPKAGRPYQLKWAPQGKFLAFAGDSPRDIKGIWVLNTETLVLTRVWHENTSYDWSPDGRQMVIIENTEQNGVAHTRPIIIDVPISDP